MTDTIHTAKIEERTAESVQNVTNDELISKKAAMEAHCELCEDKGFCGDICPDVEVFRLIPSAQPEQRWIPVSERLPEVNGRYLVTRELNACGAMWNRVYLINYSDLMGLKSERIWWNGNVGKLDFERIDDVIAWMPLPEPYAERRRLMR